MDNRGMARCPTKLDDASDVPNARRLRPVGLTLSVAGEDGTAPASTSDTMNTNPYDRMATITPNASQTRSKAPGKVGPRDRRDGYPLFLSTGDGYTVYDLDGRGYVDFIGANAAIPLGYNHPVVTEAVAREIKWPLLSMPTMLEADVAEGLARIFAGVSAVRFVKTGSEATSAALAIARAATGRRTVFVGEWSYHGWHEWARCRAASGTVDYALNDWAAVDAVETQKPAALFFEPPRWADTDVNWLRSLMTVARSVDTVIVFDELVQAFRLALAGGQERYGVVPDLTCVGKALGNGFAIAAVVGPKQFMRHATDCVSSTHGGERIGLAAARAVLDLYRENGTLSKLWDSGQAFWNEFTLLGPGTEVPRVAWLEGTPVHFRLRMAPRGTFTEADLLDRVLVASARRGYLFHRDACNASAVMPASVARDGARALALAINEVIHADEA